jgi:hypothetical protein
MRKGFKVLALLFVLLFVALFIKTEGFKKYYIGSKDRSVVFTVPFYITVLQDCDRYREFVRSKISFMPNLRCPWNKIGKIGHFELGGVEFKIPRKDLYLGKYEPDGKTDALFISFNYFDLTGEDFVGTERQRMAHTVDIKLRSNSKITGYLDCKKNVSKDARCERVDEKKYRSLLNWYLRSEENKKVSDFEFKELRRFEKRMDLGEYNLAGGKYKDTIFVIGDAYGPDNWFKCDDEEYLQLRFKNNYIIKCKGYSYYTNRIYMEYDFPNVNDLKHVDLILEEIEQRLINYTE